MQIPGILLTVIHQGFFIYSKSMCLFYLGQGELNLQIPAETPVKQAFFFATIGHSSFLCQLLFFTIFCVLHVLFEILYNPETLDHVELIQFRNTLLLVILVG